MTTPCFESLKLNRKQMIMLPVIVLVTAFLWLVPTSFYGIDGLTIVEQRTIALFAFAALMWMFEVIPTWTTSVILGVLSWSGTARVVRSETMAIRQKEYIRTIAAMGAGSWYLLRSHVFRELLPLLFYRAAARVKAGILSESSLSFLGLGSTVQKSWGAMLYYAQAKNALLTDAWLWWVLPPGLCIALLSCALVMISYSAEGKLDRRLEVRHG